VGKAKSILVSNEENGEYDKGKGIAENNEPYKE
jgi:hypothetical protein